MTHYDAPQPPARPRRGARIALSTALAAALLALLPGAAAATGLLLPTQEALPPLAIKSHRVQIDVTDQAALTRIEQVFVNHTDQQLEATFYFPVPQGATVSDFSLWINGNKTPGAVLEKDKARAIYERIVQRVRDPGLIEYMDGAIFQARIFPIPPRGEQKLEISYASILEQVGPLRRMVYPLKTGRTAARLMDDFTIVVNIDSKAPLAAIYSPTHRVDVHRKSNQKAVVGVEQTAADLEEDFMLYIGTSDDDVGLSLMTYDPDGAGGKDGTFLMVLTPRMSFDESKIPDKAVTFVIDTSGSMAGEKIDQARKALAGCLKLLRPTDRFNILAFSTSVRRLFDAPQIADANHVKEGLDFAAQLESAGGTAIDDAMTEALKANTPAGMPHSVIFMTDGRPTVGAIDPAEILAHARANNTRKARVFTVGLGYDVNPILLDATAREHHGYSDYVRPREDIQIKVTALYNKIAYPVMTNLSINYNTHRVHDVYPRRLPDLFRGGQIVVLGRYTGELPPNIALSGTLNDQPMTINFTELQPSPQDAARATAHDFIPKLWATRKVGYLLDEIRDKGELKELKDEVILLATTYGLVTPYTSFLAVDDSEFEEDARPDDIRQRHLPEISEGGSYNFDGDNLVEGHLRRDSRNYWARGQQEAALKDISKLQADQGKGSVDVSIATNNLKNVQSNDEANNNRTRFIEGRLFVFEDGTWNEVGADKKKSRKVKYLSKEYFDIVEARPDLKRRMSVGDKVLLDMGAESLSVE